MCVAQGHNTVTPVRLEPAASRSRVKRSTTEPRNEYGLSPIYPELANKHTFLIKPFKATNTTAADGNFCIIFPNFEKK